VIERARQFLAARESARLRGDRSVERAMNAELERVGYREPETTQAAAPPERAVPPKPRRRRTTTKEAT
jgi:hypothetical protein